MHWNELAHFGNALIVLIETFFSNNQETGSHGQSNLQQLHINAYVKVKFGM